MVGLYETALDALCERQVNGKTVRPKIVASTATVSRRRVFLEGGTQGLKWRDMPGAERCVAW
jgi:hypothetical protein